jgi:hypothetical protein
MLGQRRGIIRETTGHRQESGQLSFSIFIGNETSLAPTDKVNLRRVLLQARFWITSCLSL